MHMTIEHEFADRLLAKAAPPLSRRFAVYRNNLFVSLVDALIARYPAVQAAVEAEFFTAMARDYVADNLPDTPVMMQYGEQFPDYLDTFAPLADYPWIADVARVERAITQIYHAADSHGLTPHDLAAIQDLDIGALKFQLIDALTFVNAPCPVVTLWKMNTGQIEPHDVDNMPPEFALIYRPDLVVRVKALTASEATFISALREGVAVGAALEAIIAGDANFALTPILNILIHEKLIDRIVTPNTGLDIS